MKILNLKINNILSIESAEISFEETGLVLVEGWNHDVGRANGAGKTAIFNALSFAIFDKLPRKITASEILRRGTKSGSAECTIELNSGTWTVRRSRPKGVIFEHDGQIVNITQEEWEEKIRLSYTQFLVSVYCAQRGDTRFLQLNDSDKKNFLLQLLNLDKFQELRKAAEEKSKAILVEVSEIDLKLAASKSKIDAYGESLIDVDETSINIERLKRELESDTAAIRPLQEIQRPDLSKYRQLEINLSNKEQEISSARTAKTMLHDQYRRLESNIGDFNKSSSCKTCGQHVDVSDAKKLHEQHQLEILSQLKELKLEIDSYDQIISKEAEYTNLRRSIYLKKSKETEQYDSAASSINDINKLVYKKTNTLENLVVKLQNNSDLLNKITNLTTLTSKLEEQRAKKIKDQEYYKILSAIYSPTGAQAYILDSIIDSFNECITNYIYLVWPTATYSLNSFKENSKGDITAKFSESLMIDGKEVSVGSLSGGEMRAISLCVDFAIMDVMQNNFGIKINPSILDEPFEGLDSIGKEIVIGLLEKIAQTRQILVVDHGSEAKAMFTKTISVELRNKISTVKVGF